MPITQNEQTFANSIRDLPLIPANAGAETFNAMVTRQLAEAGISREAYESIRNATIGQAQERVMNSIGDNREMARASVDLIQIGRASQDRMGDVALARLPNVSAAQVRTLQGLIAGEIDIANLAIGAIQSGRENPLADAARLGGMGQSNRAIDNAMRDLPFIHTNSSLPMSSDVPRESFNAMLTRRLNEVGINREIYEGIRNATIGQAQERVMNSGGSNGEMARAASDLLDITRANQARIADVAQVNGLPNINAAQERTLRTLLAQDAAMTTLSAGTIQTTADNLLTQGTELGQNIAREALRTVRNVPILGQMFTSMVPAGSTGIPESGPTQTPRNDQQAPAVAPRRGG